MDEFYIMGQLVMRGSRVVMPEKLWIQTIELPHEGHQGIVRPKSRSREKVWWPDMEKQVDRLVRTCYPCQLAGPRPKPEPIRSTPLPQGLWRENAVDLLEIPNKVHLLVVVDYYSEWPEVAFLSKTNAETVIMSMENMCHTHSLPETRRSDNVPPFASTEFEGFLEYFPIDQKKANKTLLKAIRIASCKARSGRRNCKTSFSSTATLPIR